MIGAVIADGILFALLYYVLYKWCFGIWPAVSPRLAFLLTLWSLASYVIGRYFSGDKRGFEIEAWDFVGKQLIGTGTALLLTLGITLLHIWLFNKNPVQASFHSFLIPFLLLLAVLSIFLQLTIRRLSAIRDQDSISTWAYVGSDSGFQRLQELLRWSRVRIRFEHVQPENLSKTFFVKYVVDRFHGQHPGLLKSLSQYQLRGSVVYNRLAWCEAVLQRFPSDFLSEADLLAGGFSVAESTFQVRLKRVGDVVVAMTLLLITSPLILLSALLIKFSDRGPIFYSQVRTGLDGSPFKIWKLRTMRIDAEYQGAQWSSRSDPRITKVGALLRITRVDELPQLWCVLAGSMSLIGPRPERPEFDQQLSRKIPFYELRHHIRPGLSGWAQVNYPYGASIEDSANKLSYDLYYIKHFSFLLDLLILFKTIRLVFNAQGALPEHSAASNPSS
ncbi:exopolysaccharide biosynthesis polyprenyl glycosylphosphotransferase [Synechococcus sp. TAK9802]|uniref:exopolysaccharide biosynthesis polyprenyl glycosylphosphotransferase n=1 Tax=Synechococcus sp. TAK9802 TaxID=1442558 RepID=UPI002104C8BF|nr:exopolysaccharide biosynthesis polyprenyl glycosylphosphotransferase [Synechococcus sp. TAK9802]